MHATCAEAGELRSTSGAAVVLLFDAGQGAAFQR
jgi:hypothetical protein